MEISDQSVFESQRVLWGQSMGERISPETARIYEVRARRFRDWCAARRLAISAQSIALAYEALSRELRESSRRQYRAALSWWISRELGADQWRIFGELAGGIDRGWRERQLVDGGESEKRLRKSTKLIKHLPTAVRDLIVEQLYMLGTTWGLMAGDILLAGSVTGLRPKEWAYATIEGEALRVRNSKYINGFRANGEERVLYIDWRRVSNHEREAISRTILTMRGRQWGSVRPNLGPVLKDVIERLVKAGLVSPKWRKLRFYDARHQAAADLKASLRLEKGEVAAAMGHASALTAVQMYGRRRKAARVSPVRPSNEAVLAVKEATIQRLVKKYPGMLGVGDAVSLPAPVVISPTNERSDPNFK